jgi:hypothetical protein
MNIPVTYFHNSPIPVAERSKVWVCAHEIAGIAVSNPAGLEYLSHVIVVCFAGRGLCDVPITRPGNSYQLHVFRFVIKCNNTYSE